jgi:hypothetical protein
MGNECVICDQRFESEEELFKHVKKVHKLPKYKYFLDYYHKKDPLTHELIPFRSVEQYLLSDFVNKENLRTWLERQSPEAQKQYCENILILRKQVKGLIYAPCQVELRSVMSPSMIFLNKIFEDGYYQLCGRLGFQNKFKYFNGWAETIDLDKRRKVFIDTREQKPLKFKHLKTVDKKLDYGDYCFSNDEWTDKTYIERKSMMDFIGTISGGYERFTNELIRCQEDNAYLIIMVEQLLSTCLEFDTLPNMPPQMKATPEFIFHRVRELLQKFPNIQFLFVKDRPTASEKIEFLFSAGAQIKNYDLQYLYDIKVL